MTAAPKVKIKLDEANPQAVRAMRQSAAENAGSIVYARNSQSIISLKRAEEFRKKVSQRIGVVESGVAGMQTTMLLTPGPAVARIGVRDQVGDGSRDGAGDEKRVRTLPRG
jgi:hypothetical protein